MKYSRTLGYSDRNNYFIIILFEIRKEKVAEVLKNLISGIYGRGLFKEVGDM